MFVFHNKKIDFIHRVTHIARWFFLFRLQTGLHKFIKLAGMNSQNEPNTPQRRLHE